MPIIVSQNGSKTQLLDESAVADEDYLQRYVFENPESIPVRDIKEGARLMVICREFPTNAGKIDVLAVDADGDLYIVETKLFKNPDKRLVVAQVLDYGASMWRAYSDPATFVGEVDRELTKSGRANLSNSLTEFYGLDDESTARLLDNLRANLQAGNIHFVVLMNRLHDALKDLILFLNHRSGFSLYAVEMSFYRSQGLEVVIPKLFGAEVTKAIGSSASRRKWNEESFFEEAKKNLNEMQFAAMMKLYGFSRENGEIRWGTRKGRGRLIVSFDAPEICLGTDGVLSVWSIWLPRHGEELKHWPERIRNAFAKSGFDVSIRGELDDDSADLQLKVWAPRVDDLICAIRMLMQKP